MTTITNSTVQKARDIAFEAHHGQFRHDGKTPYIVHPEDVASRLTDHIEQAVAWLHDVLEDHSDKFNASLLVQMGIPLVVVSAAGVLTKAKDEDYFDYIRRVGVHPVTRHVKIADIMSNLSDSPSRNQIKKYPVALSMLLEMDVPTYVHPAKPIRI